MNTALRFYASTILGSLLFFFSSAGTSWGSDWLILSPGVALSDGKPGFGGQAKFFFVPNLGVETDAVWTPQICSDCHLTQTTLTENLFYWINPFSVLSLYLAGGGGLGLFQLGSPQSGTSLLPIFDIGMGAVFWPEKHVGLEIENRWFFPAGGGLEGNPASRLDTNRWFAGIAIPL